MMTLYFVWVSVILVVQLQVCLCVGEDHPGLMYSRDAGTEDWTDDFCIYYNPGFHPLPQGKQHGETYRLLDLSSTDGCNMSDFDTVNTTGEDLAVIVARGECHFSVKAYNAQNASVKAIIVASDQLFTPAPTNATVDYKDINITVALILWKSVHEIQKMAPDIEVLIYSTENELKVDPNFALIFLIAVSCVSIGSLWAGNQKYKKYLKIVEEKRQEELGSPATNGSDPDKETEEEDQSVDITLPAICVFFVLVCTFIVLLYFFYDQLVYAVIGLFCLAGAMGMYACLNPIWKKLVPIRARVPPNRIPILRGRPEYRNMFFGLVCMGVGVWFGVERHAAYSWVLQDTLGFLFCINVMRSITVPNLKICTIMLTLLFLYDIFFVFISPLFTSSGDSIMVKVATGGDSKTQETIPMAFRVPKLAPGVCPASESLLGFGDIVIPGLLVCHNHAFDLRAGTPRKLYLVATTVAYSVGLVVTFAALFLMKSGQPALLYIVPCTLVTTFLIGCCRGEVKQLWSGSLYTTMPAKTNSSPSVNQSSKTAGGSTATVNSSDSGTDNESRELIAK